MRALAQRLAAGLPVVHEVVPESLDAGREGLNARELAGQLIALLEPTMITGLDFRGNGVVLSFFHEGAHYRVQVDELRR